MNASPTLLDALRATVAFTPLGDPAGNLTLAEGRLEDRSLLGVFVENRIASGSIGTKEVARLVPALRSAGARKQPVVWFLDSAGARVSEGLAALGAFRQLYREALLAAGAGSPFAALLGRNCYGGASMLAHLSHRRLFSPQSQLAMSGPSVLAQAAGVSALDEMFRAMAEATLNAAARSKQSPANATWSPGQDIATWLREVTEPIEKPWGTYHRRHTELGSRLPPPASPRPPETVRRKDLDRLFAGGYDIRDSLGFFRGTATVPGAAVPVLGLVGGGGVGAARSWQFAEAAWNLARGPAGPLEILLDCDVHAARLEDEKLILTDYIVDMGLALGALAARGHRITLTILGKAGGGVYVALAAAAARVRSVHGADIQVLPGSAVASILGESREAISDFDDYRKAGVSDEEMRLGLLG